MSIYNDITLSYVDGSDLVEIANIVDDFTIGESTIENMEVKKHGTGLVVSNVPGWRKGSEFECTVEYTETQSVDLQTLHRARTVVTFVITLLDGPTISGEGYISGFGHETSQDNIYKNTIKIMPETDWTLADSASA